MGKTSSWHGRPGGRSAMSDIERLRQRVRDRQAEIDEETAIKEKRKKQAREYTAYLKLPEESEQDMFCEHCLLDFRGPAYKEWSWLFGVGAWVSFCPLCGLPKCRWITGKTNDPYYEQAQKIRSMRSEYEADILRPDQWGFQTLYGDPFEKYAQQSANQEQEVRSRFLEMGLGGITIQEKSEREKIKEYF